MIFFVVGVIVCGAIEGGVLWATELMAEAEKGSRFRRPIRVVSVIGLVLVFAGFSIYAYLNRDLLADGLGALVP